MTRSHLLCLITSALLTAGCGGGKGDAQKKAGTPAAPPKPKVAVATTTMLADLVRKVAGDGFEVVGLMGPGVDPHLYKNTTGDLNSMQRAKVTFYNGFHLEGRMEEVFDAMRGRGKSMVAVGEAVPKEDRIVPKDGAGHPDPHVWGDVRNWILAIEPVAQGLSAADPEGKAKYEANAAALRAEWTALHEWAKKRAEEIAPEKRVLITSHDAFAYFGRAYGFEVVGVQGVSTSSEAGLADIARTVDFIKERKLPALFVESSVPHATIERISQDAGAKIGGELFSDACGLPGKMVTVNGETYDLGTYAGWVKHNINTVVEALK